jgi:hypothetical protein
MCRARLFHGAMFHVLSPEDRLEILRAADSFRRWSSLDDKRICAICNRLITGTEIEIRRDQRGRFLLHCPTSGCASTAQDWLLQQDADGIEEHFVPSRSEMSFMF